MSTTSLQQISAAANWQLRANENFDSVSPAGLYGRNPATTTGLTWGYLGGEFGAVSPANGTVSLAASTTNYIVAHRTTGVVSSATNMTNWLNIGTYLQLYQVVTGASTVTSYVDRRRAIGAGVVFSVVAGTGITVDSTDPANPIINATGGGGGGSSDMFSPLVSGEIAVTTTATLTLGRIHVCSGTTADYTVTLPAVAGNAGKFVGLRMAPGLTRWVTLKGNAAEPIDGSNTRRMWANESAVVFCDGTTWTKVAGKTVPVHAVMSRQTAQAMTVAAWVQIPMTTIGYDNTSALAVPAADTSGGRIRVLRPGSYFAQGFVTGENFVVGKTLAGGVVNTTGASFDPAGLPHAWGAMAGAALLHAGGSGVFNAAASTYFYVTAFNGDTVSRSTPVASSIIEPTLSAIEQPTW